MNKICIIFVLLLSFSCSNEYRENEGDIADKNRGKSILFENLERLGLKIENTLDSDGYLVFTKVQFSSELAYFANYYDNNKFCCESLIRNGMIDGIMNCYSENGELVSSVVYKMGEKIEK